MEKRKIVGFGKSSLIVSLPKEWLAENKIKKGDDIFLDSDGDNLILSNTAISLKKVERKCIIDATIEKPLPGIKREICARYINNYNIIEVRGARLKTNSTEIKEYIRNLMVFEILQEDEEKIISRDFLDINSINAEEIVKRMYNSLRSGFTELAQKITEKTYENLSEKEAQMNSYFFLMQRFMRFHLERKNQKDNLLKMFDYWQTASNLEDIGNYLRNIFLAQYNKEVEVTDQIVHLLRECESYFKENMTAFFQKDSKKLNLLAEKRKELFEKIDKLRTEENKIFLDQFMLIVTRTHKAARVMLSFTD